MSTSLLSSLRSALRWTSGAGRISGVVADRGGRRERGVVVEAVSRTGLRRTTSTDASGAYAFAGLPPSAYAVCTVGTLAVTRSCWQGGDRSRPDGTLAAATSRTATTVVDLTVGTSGGLAGTVTDEDGLPVAGVPVSAFDLDAPAPRSSGTTRADGTYEIDGLPSGDDVEVCFVADNPLDRAPAPYVDQCWRGAETDETGGLSSTPVRVLPAVAVPGVDATLHTAGVLSGSVTDDRGVGVAGVPVYLARWSSSYAPVEQVRTAPDGTYSLAGVQPGDWAVCADPRSLVTVDAPYGYGPACWQAHPGSQSPLDADSVQTGDDTVRPALDMVLERSTAVSGTVTSGRDRIPLAGVAVHVQGPYTGRDTTTDALGRWAVTGLRPGVTSACFTPTQTQAYAPACHDGGQAFTVAPGTAAVGVDDALAPTGTVHVTAVDDRGAALRLTSFELLDPGDGLAVGHDETFAEDGTATVPFVPAGTYRLCAVRAEGPVEQGYQQQSTGGCGYAPSAVNVSVTVTSGDTTEATATLPRAGAISGRVTDSAGTPYAGVSVLLFLRGSPDDLGTDPRYALDAPVLTDSDGDYEVRGVTPGTYDVCFAVSTPTSSNRTCVGQTSADGSGPGTAFAVSQAATTSGVDGRLPRS